jgi:hypothetical protein
MGDTVGAGAWVACLSYFACRMLSTWMRRVNGFLTIVFDI